MTGMYIVLAAIGVFALLVFTVGIVMMLGADAAGRADDGADILTAGLKDFFDQLGPPPGWTPGQTQPPLGPVDQYWSSIEHLFIEPDGIQRLEDFVNAKENH